MHPSRRPSPPHSPADAREHERSSLKRTRQESLSPPVLSAHSYGGTSLPSIHQLHPGLPPAGQQRHAPSTQYGTSEFLPAPSYGSRSFFAGGQASGGPPTFPHPHDERRLFERLPPGPSSLSTTHSVPEQRISPTADSDQDQNESERLGPPKKKRRRQALSCTECKRRKIKCDRTHPCGPCSRRHEPDKCQWHVVEPVEKYVTRTEWDELYSRYRLLEDRCMRLEHLIMQQHSEYAVHSPYDAISGHAAGHSSLASPTGPRSTSLRAYPLTGPGVTGASQPRTTPNTTPNTLPAPGKAVSTHGISTGTDTEASASSARSGSAPPPPPATTQPAHAHPPQSSDRRTCASGLHGSPSAASERPPTLHHQVPGPQRVPPLTDPTPRSYTFPPPPPPVAAAAGAAAARGSQSPRRHGGSPTASPNTPQVPKRHSSPLSSQGNAHLARQGVPSRVDAGPGTEHTNVHPNSRFVGQHPHQHAYSPAQQQQQQQQRTVPRGLQLPSPTRSREAFPKNGGAQTSEAGNVLRRKRSSASPRDDGEAVHAHTSLKLWSDPGSPVSVPRPASRQDSRDIDADTTDCPRSDAEAVESAAPSVKRARRSSLYLSIPPSSGKAATPPPVLVMH
ncbi:hypothetical protein M0805_008148 [Coniferiporia weirii]|nr:hypothetical protein M0805_008148 [Coniferiporia weirii]